MQTIRVVQKAAADGTLSLQLPLGTPEMEYDVLVFVTPRHDESTSQELGWPEGYFALAGSIADETFCRPPQGEFPKSVEID